MKTIFKSLTLACAMFSMLSSVSIAFALNQNNQATSLSEQLAKLEADNDGRIGLYAIDTANNTHLQYRADERFPAASTAKVMAVSLLLKQSMSNPKLLAEKISYNKSDLEKWSPFTEKHVGEEVTYAQLAEATIAQSDGTGLNLIVDKTGGKSAVNQFARSIGDKSYNLENFTSTPAAMAKSLQKLILENVLAKPQRDLLWSWLKNNTTGDLRIRAGVPKGWVVGDKTGTGIEYGITNDIAVIWPPQCKPIVLSIYFKHNEETAKIAPQILATATRLVISELSKTNQCVVAALDNKV